MATHLVIVESPAKGKTIEKYLGKDFKVMASYGHVRDLIPKEGAVDPNAQFAMKYELIERNKKHVDAIKKALKDCDQLLLATDPDREGEAIAWHLVELLTQANALKDKHVSRVVFHEITKRAVQEAVAQPREIAYDLVNAQQARRALDYLVGFNLSPLLWRKIKRGLSAGRVQSPALKMIVEREEEIERFEAQEYWSIDAKVQREQTPFSARLYRLAGEKAKQFTVTSGEQAAEVKARLLQVSGGSLRVGSIEKRQRRRNPAPPFTTSTLQQEAVRKLGFTAQRTMRVAQQLYEGIDIGDGAVGLITYMRTDSFTLSQEALGELRETIGRRFGPDKVPEKPNFYRNKSKNAQEAHEAVRPTSAARHPDELKAHLERDQLRLYELIWKRTLACQMTPAVYDQVAAELQCGPDDSFRASGSVLIEPGFLSVYREGRDDDADDEDENKRLPALVEGELVTLNDILTAQHFTEPPPRFTEASLVKALEEFGIGRPSTYASIISTLQSRDYVEMDARRFMPTDTGRVVNRFLSGHFTRYVDYDFTAKLEDELDAVSRGEKEWVPLMENFWHDFSAQVEDKAANVTRAEAVQARQLGTDPGSGKPVSVRLARFGPVVQIGTVEDEEKPRFAGLLPGQKMDQITLDEAMALFRLPRDLGETPEGEKVSVNIGRFGPYVKYASKFASLKEGDPYSLTLEEALVVIADKKEADANKIIHTFPDTEIQILNGRWGPYVSDGKKNGKIPKELKEKPLSITLEQAQQWIDEAPDKKRGKTSKKAEEKSATAKKRTSKAAASKDDAEAKTKTKTTKKPAAKKPAAKKAPAKAKAPRKSAVKKTAAKTDGPSDAAEAS